MREQLARPHSLFGCPGAFYSSLEADIDHMVKGGEEIHRCGAFSVAFGIETLVFEGGSKERYYIMFAIGEFNTGHCHPWIL